MIKDGYKKEKWENNVKKVLVYQLFHINARFWEWKCFVLVCPFCPKFIVNVPENASEICCLLFFFLVFPYFSTSNRIGIILNWKLRQCVAVEDKIYKVVQMNSCGGKNYLTVSCKMYRNILLHSQIGYRNFDFD